MQGPGGSMDHPMAEVKEDQQEMWLKRWVWEGYRRQ